MTPSQQTLSLSLSSGGMGTSIPIYAQRTDRLIGTFHSSKVFPANARQAGGPISRDALRSSQKRLRESRARQNRT